ncbi:hypothetical protein [Hydrogenimonas cancrithermarum]|uniref:Uncharacterized protein n=1 Tax=Hydrogenimonas cancrithermarum TaxID=2993563 RepID=A0ABN6WZX2_9BACT|nr:hypothetical protein [Hydrogenimonas cancrithermarum]BDY14010.1 hypothetical protein HCR_23230 [Hydrogenimonas cancrithermarum]
MAIKRIDIDKETFELLKKHFEPLNERPRSVSVFEDALSHIVKEYDRNHNKSVDLDDETENRIEGLAAYGIIESREAFIQKCVKECANELLPELERRIEEEISRKKRMYGLEEKRSS